MGGLMTTDDGKPKSMHAFVRLAEKGLWTAVSAEVQAFTQRTLAVSLQKLMEVFVRPLFPFSVLCCMTELIGRAEGPAWRSLHL